MAAEQFETNVYFWLPRLFDLASWLGDEHLSCYSTCGLKSHSGSPTLSVYGADPLIFWMASKMGVKMSVA